MWSSDNITGNNIIYREHEIINAPQIWQWHFLWTEYFHVKSRTFLTKKWFITDAKAELQVGFFTCTVHLPPTLWSWHVYAKLSCDGEKLLALLNRYLSFGHLLLSVLLKATGTRSAALSPVRCHQLWQRETKATLLPITLLLGGNNLAIDVANHMNKSTCSSGIRHPTWSSGIRHPTHFYRLLIERSDEPKIKN